MAGWLERMQARPRGPRALCTGSTLAGQLDLKQISAGKFWSTVHQGWPSRPCEAKVVWSEVFWGDWYLCHLETKAGAVVSANQEGESQCALSCGHPGGWLDVLWARVLGSLRWYVS